MHKNAVLHGIAEKKCVYMHGKVIYIGYMCGNKRWTLRKRHRCNNNPQKLPRFM